MSTETRPNAAYQNSSHNATKHGLTGAQIVIRGEDPAAYNALRQSLIAEYQPANEEESMLVEQIAQNWWRLQRALRYEKDLFENGAGMGTRGFDTFLRYKNAAERAWNRARRELAELQKQRIADAPLRAIKVKWARPESVLTAAAAPQVASSSTGPNTP